MVIERHTGIEVDLDEIHENAYTSKRRYSNEDRRKSIVDRK